MERVFVKNTYNQQLSVVKSLPQVQQKFPAVICVHGFGLKKGGFGLFDTIVEELDQQNFATFQFDFAGCGESQGDYVDTSLTKQVDDLKTIYTYVKSQPEIDPDKIYVVAHSFGCTVVIASQLAFTKAAFLGAIFHSKDIFAQIFGAGYNPQSVSVKKWTDKWSTKVGPQFWSDLENYNLADLSDKIKYSSLFIHGDADDKVPISEAREYQKYTEKSNLKIIENADHMMRPKVENVSRAVLDFFSE